MKPKTKKRTKPVPLCQACGACCAPVHDQDAFCDLTPEDLGRLSRRQITKYVLFETPFQLLVAELGGRRQPPAVLRTRWLRSRSGPFRDVDVCACCMLSGSLLHSVRCRIYPYRPSVCRRAIRPGDQNCLRIRRMFRDLLERR